MATPPLLKLLLSNLSEIINMSDFTGDCSLDNLHASTQQSTLGNCICGGDGFHSDYADARIVLTAIMRAVAEVA